MRSPCFDAPSPSKGTRCKAQYIIPGFSLASVQRVRPEENVVCRRFYKAHSLLFSHSQCLESKQRQITSMIRGDVRSWKLLVSSPVWNNGKGNSNITLFLSAPRALGNVHVWSAERLFPCSPGGSLGGHVVWFISLHCQLMNGMRWSTCHTLLSGDRSPDGCTSWGFSHSH